MSTPNPLIPQGTFQAQAARGASNVRLAVATIVAIHVVFFGGLLLQGCKRDTQTTQNTEPVTNAEPSTNLALPTLESSSLYYTSSNTLPADSTAGSGAPTAQATGLTPPPASGATSPDAMWQTTNLSSSLQGGIQTEPPTIGLQSSGATKEYTVVRGDSFSRIAVRQGTTVAALRAANPEVDPLKIKPGDKINVPEGAPQLAASPATVGASGPETIYTVKAGDNLTKIARQHHTTISQLRAANNLRTSQVRVGQKLKIPAPTPAEATGAANLPRNQGL